MKIKYEFLTGESVEVEVDDDLGEIIVQIENDTYNSNRRETRRHESLSDSVTDFASSDDVEIEVLRKMEDAALHQIISTLRHDEQELIHRLYLNNPTISQAEYAQEQGVSENAINQKAKKIRLKLKKMLDL